MPCYRMVARIDEYLCICAARTPNKKRCSIVSERKAHNLEEVVRIHPSLLVVLSSSGQGYRPLKPETSVQIAPRPSTRKKEKKNGIL